ncbi:hypothetical protein [Pedobacter sp. FW305-3-2-15-E-R2A2]
MKQLFSSLADQSKQIENGVMKKTSTIQISQNDAGPDPYRY